MPLLRIGLTFLHVGALAFGGLGATLALIERLAVHRGLLSREQLTEALTYTKLLPGSTVVQIVAYLGWRVRGWSGSALATAAFILPSAVFMTALAAGYDRIAGLPATAAIRQAVLAAVVALLVITMERLGRPLMTGLLPIVVGVVALLVVLVLNVSAVWAVVGAGIVGMFTDRRAS
jgi:chromate transporter